MAWSPPALNAGIVWVSAPGDYATFNSNHTPDGTSVIIEFPPSAGAAPHRHGAAFVWVYVLAGTIRIKLNDEPIRTCREAESWFEEPSTHHLLAENNSTTEPAKLLAVFISNPGDPLKVDDAGKPDSL
jgi:quercetin dioxygenase-like cupin family protein